MKLKDLLEEIRNMDDNANDEEVSTMVDKIRDLGYLDYWVVEDQACVHCPPLYTALREMVAEKGW